MKKLFLLTTAAILIASSAMTAHAAKHSKKHNPAAQAAQTSPAAPPGQPSQAAPAKSVPLTRKASEDNRYPVFSLLAEGWGGGNLKAFERGQAKSSASGEIDKNSLGADGGELRVGVLFSPGVYIQGDLAGEDTTNNKKYNDVLNSDFTRTVHLGFGNQEYLLSGFIGQGKVWTEADSDDMVGFWFRGVEFQRFTEKTLWYAQAGAFDQTNSFGQKNADYLDNGWYLRGAAKYSLSELNKLSGQLSYANADSSGRSTDVADLGLRFDRSLQTSVPLSVFASYSGVYTDNGLGSYLDNVGRIGIQFRFGGAETHSSKLGGATLDTPNLGRWIGSSNAVD